MGRIRLAFAWGDLFILDVIFSEEHLLGKQSRDPSKTQFVIRHQSNMVLSVLDLKKLVNQLLEIE